jgi:hypothetical protein
LAGRRGQAEFWLYGSEADLHYSLEGAKDANLVGPDLVGPEMGSTYLLSL